MIVAVAVVSSSIAAPSATPCAASTSHLHQSGDYGGKTSPDPYSRRSGLKTRVRKKNRLKKEKYGERRTEPRPRPRTKDLLPVCSHVAEPPHVAFAADAAPLGVPCLPCAALLTCVGARSISLRTGKEWRGKGRTRNPRTNA